MRTSLLTIAQTRPIMFGSTSFGVSSTQGVDAYPKSGVYKCTGIEFSLESLPDGKPVQYANFGIACVGEGVLSSVSPQSSFAQIAVGTVIDFSKIDQGGNLFFTYTICLSQATGAGPVYIVGCKMVAQFEQVRQ